MSSVGWGIAGLVASIWVIGAGCGGGAGGSDGGTGGSSTDAGGSTGGAAGAPVADAGTDAATDSAAACAPASPRTISDAPATSNARNVHLVAASSGYGVVWSDNREGNTEIYFTRLDARGDRVGTVVRVTSAAGQSAAPDLVWTGSEFALTWFDDRDGNTEIYLARLSADGTKTGADLRVTNDAARSEFPAIAWTGTEFGLVWNDTREGTFQIYFTRVSAIGAKVGADLRVSTGTALAASPVLVWSGNGYGAAWHDLRDAMGLQIYFARLSATGALVGTEKRLSALNLQGGNAAIAWSGTSYGVTWIGNTISAGEVYLALVDAAGTPTGTAAALTSTTGTATAAALAVRAGGWLVGWSDRREADLEVHLRPFDATGAPAGADIKVSNDITDSASPSIAASIAGFAAAWSDQPTTSTGAPWFAGVCP